MRSLFFVVAILSSVSAVAEEESRTFTLETGVTIVEQVELSDASQYVDIRKAKNGYEVLVETTMLCAGKLASPWLSVADKPTLVIQKQKSASPFHSGEECMYRLRIAVAADRLDSEQTLYVVNGQEVVGHVRVP
jgi:hypothetical protein